MELRWSRSRRYRAWSWLGQSSTGWSPSVVETNSFHSQQLFLRLCSWWKCEWRGECLSEHSTSGTFPTAATTATTATATTTAASFHDESTTTYTGSVLSNSLRQTGTDSKSHYPISSTCVCSERFDTVSTWPTFAASQTRHGPNSRYAIPSILNLMKKDLFSSIRLLEEGLEVELGKCFSFSNIRHDLSPPSRTNL